MNDFLLQVLVKLYTLCSTCDRLSEYKVCNAVNWI